MYQYDEANQQAVTTVEMAHNNNATHNAVLTPPSFETPED